MSIQVRCRDCGAEVRIRSAEAAELLGYRCEQCIRAAVRARHGLPGPGRVVKPEASVVTAAGAMDDLFGGEF